MSIRVELAKVLIQETEDHHVVVLREVEGGRDFPIVIGINEAAAIERRLMGEAPPRPQTHELLANVIEELGFRLERVEINDLRDHTFFARLHLSDGSRHVEIDSRPSDALALGAAGDVPIYVAEHVLDEVAGGQ
ncbi:MAG: bifunctional nuclease family protein [Phycisphaeraceae bacterium]|nr:bifunctional nuclease family protein [Phycisphaeraceae bacterium]